MNFRNIQKHRVCGVLRAFEVCKITHTQQENATALSVYTQQLRRCFKRNKEYDIFDYAFDCV